ncbi:hypothetical protein [Paraburkholderia sp. MM5384-R2]|uniref:hypothetical protein n=1 Tax=Paraburkholderia sp. MM5384-R2 TaxID=2723097 RepID=UPI0016107CD1|nr:hypothetical protein [Paraburkholderia sp. MM5384-R2]MBB5503306.1 hypothetical protein [Paraburkholderia sp. MM5384-R2]
MIRKLFQERMFAARLDRDRTICAAASNGWPIPLISCIALRRKRRITGAGIAQLSFCSSLYDCSTDNQIAIAIGF